MTSQPITLLKRDQSGAIVVEAALTLPIIVFLLSGILSYALYFMAAHSLQQGANEGARASLAGLNQTERDELAAAAVKRAVSGGVIVKPQAVTFASRVKGNFYTVDIAYDATGDALLSKSLVPMPSPKIVRSATIELASY